MSSAAVYQAATFKPSKAAQQRVWELVRREKEIGLTADESQELDTFVQLEHILRMAKAKARLRLRKGEW